MTDIETKAAETLAFLRSRTGATPRFGLILGTGLGGLAREIEAEARIEYSAIPNFAQATVESHRGRLIFGGLAGVPVVAMEGRFHSYEGWSLEEVTFPVRVMKRLGVEALVVSNAAGCINPGWRKGELMLISDHINLMGGNPLVGVRDSLGSLFPDMSDPYDQGFRQRARQAAADAGIALREGVYAAMTGPSLETRAEYRMLKILGADAIGMSTVPEVITARQLGLRVLGLSILTDECFPDTLAPASVEDIIATAGKAEPSLTALAKAWIAREAAR
jgi:purine-nucleoside phosphorylase